MITAVFSMILSIIMYQRYKKRLTEERMFVKEQYTAINGEKKFKIVVSIQLKYRYSMCFCIKYTV